MRYVFGLISVLMILAALMQYNDPDGVKWMVVYAVPAIWAGIAAYRPEHIASRTGRALLVISIATAAILTLIVWPPAHWWRHEVWTMGTAVDGPAVAERAREGMGLMIVTAVLLTVYASSFFRSSSKVVPQT